MTRLVPDHPAAERKEEGKVSDEGTLESKTIGNQLSDLSMHMPFEC